MMNDVWLLSWRSRDADGWRDVIEANWLVPSTAPYRVEHWIVGRNRDVVRAICDVSSADGKIIEFNYEGSLAAQNRKVGVGIGVMRIDPAALRTAKAIAWKDEGEEAFSDYPVVVRQLRESEGTRRSHVTSRVRRSSLLARLKIAFASEQDSGLRCEACGFAGLDNYGEARKSCFEVHHRDPVSTGERETSLEALAVLCANCHRVYHSLGEPPFADFVASLDRIDD